MSTKIYGGLKLKDSSADLYEVVTTVAKAIREQFETEAFELVAKYLAAAADSKSIRDDSKASDYLFYQAEDEWKKRQDSFGRHHTLNDPLRFSIVFGRSSEGNILSVPYTSNIASYDRALEATGLFEEYGYWNNTDQPDGITDEQWDARGKEWESIENSEGTFGDLPTWELGGTMDVWTHVLLQKGRKEDLNVFYSQTARLENAISHALLGNLIEADTDKTNPFRHVFTASRLARSFMKTDDAKELTLPEPLPDHFMVKIGDLPPLYEVAPSVVELILSKREELDH